MDHVRANEHRYLMTVNQVSNCTSISHTWVDVNKFSNQKQVYGQILVKEKKEKKLAVTLSNRKQYRKNFPLSFNMRLLDCINAIFTYGFCYME